MAEANFFPKGKRSFTASKIVACDYAYLKADNAVPVIAMEQ